MLSDLFTTLAIVLLILAISLGFLFALHRFWPIEERRKHNDLIGWQISVVGTTYAVIVGFMLYAVWNNYQTADSNAEAEANSVVNVVRSAQGLPEADRGAIEDLGRAYINDMLQNEWPAMLKVRFSPQSAVLVDRLWATATSAGVRDIRQQTSLDHTLSSLATMTEHRRLRQIQAVSSIPGILWTVLILGGSVTIISACLFGSSNFRLHLVQVTMLALMLSMTLVAIADMSSPFQGVVRVSTAAFERARITLNRTSQ